MFTIYYILCILIILCIIGYFTIEIVNSIIYKHKTKHATKQTTESKITLIIDSNKDEYEFIDNNNKYLKEAINGDNDYLYDTYDNTYVKVSEIVSIQQFIFKKTDCYYKGDFIDSVEKYYTLEGIEYDE